MHSTAADSKTEKLMNVQQSKIHLAIVIYDYYPG